MSRNVSTASWRGRNPSVAMASLSTVTITLNEEANIVDCLASVRWADELIVVDSGSKDRTVELARSLTGRVLTVPWKGYGTSRNLALEHVTGDWVLWLDADERVTPELAAEIRDLIVRDDRNVAGYSVARRAYFLGQWIKHCGWYPSRVVRLFRKGHGRFEETNVHERLLLEGRTEPLYHDLLHFTDHTLYHYFGKFNRYTSLAAQDMHAAGKRFSLLGLCIRPPFVFFRMFLIRAGFLDGMHGFVLSLLSSVYVFAKYAKLWELQKKEAQ
jgi:glycosyltransferase involved in cell wall biosynthesis